MPDIYLQDVVIHLAGWPVELRTAATVLDKADEILANDGGRQCRRQLTDDELTEFGVSADSIQPRTAADRRFPLRVPAELHGRIRSCAEATGLSMNLWACQALLAAVLRQEREEV